MSATTKTPAPPSAGEKTRRDRIVAAAKAEGRIIDEKGWRATFDEAPASTERLLTASADQGGLVAAGAPVAASSKPRTADELLQASRVRMGLAAPPAPAPMATAKEQQLLLASRVRMGTGRGPTGTAAEEALMEASRRRMGLAR